MAHRGSRERVWSSITLLINFEVIEWHISDRVLTHIGLRQDVPQPCDLGVALFCISQRRHVVPLIGLRGMLCGLWGLAMTICGDKNITYGYDAKRRSIDCVVSLYYEKFYHPSTVQRVNSF